jgi:hypothetical protein
MKNFTYALAATACLLVGGAAAGPATGAGQAPVVLAQAPELNIGVGVGVGERDRGRSGVVVQERDRDFDRRRVESRDYRYNNRARIVVRGAPSCRFVTVRERLGNGRLIIRKIRRCV